MLQLLPECHPLVNLLITQQKQLPQALATEMQITDKNRDTYKENEVFEMHENQSVLVVLCFSFILDKIC